MKNINYQSNWDPKEIRHLGTVYIDVSGSTGSGKTIIVHLLEDFFREKGANVQVKTSSTLIKGPVMTVEDLRNLTFKDRDIVISDDLRNEPVPELQLEIKKLKNEILELQKHFDIEFNLPE